MGNKILMSIFWLVIVIIITTLPVMWLWNWLMPVIFGLTQITFWQALGLNMLSSMLFKSKIITPPTKD